MMKMETDKIVDDVKSQVSLRSSQNRLKAEVVLELDGF